MICLRGSKATPGLPENSKGRNRTNSANSGVITRLRMVKCIVRYHPETNRIHWRGYERVMRFGKQFQVRSA